MDLEGLANRLLDKGLSEGKITDRLTLEITTFKNVDKARAKKLSQAVLNEVKTARKKAADRELMEILDVPNSGATMHDLGVGCRGEGDFFVHRLIVDIACTNGLQSSVLSPVLAKTEDRRLKTALLPTDLDDAGAVKANGKIIVAAVDGTHSRLSDFPFIAGFHVARAAMRDVMVKGARPVALIDDLHLSDDGDVGKLFDFVAGIAAVSELTGVPLIAGSTLRTGGDMVIGTRMVSGVGCIGVADRLLKRADVKTGDSILMTSGSGGGTIATTAIYSGSPEYVKETLNVDFIDAVNALSKKGLLKKMHCMLDVTNGGLRGDANEVCKTAGVGIELHEKKVRSVVNPKVLKMLNKLEIDYLGVSLDSLLIFCAQKEKAGVLKALEGGRIMAAEVGRVISGDKALLDGAAFKPKFRESAYTGVKKLIGEKAPEEEQRLKEGARNSALRAKEKMEKVVKYVRAQRGKTC